MNRINSIIDRGKWDNTTDRHYRRYALWFEGFEDSEVSKILKADTPAKAKEIARKTRKVARQIHHEKAKEIAKEIGRVQ